MACRQNSEFEYYLRIAKLESLNYLRNIIWYSRFESILVLSQNPCFSVLAYVGRLTFLVPSGSSVVGAPSDWRCERPLAPSLRSNLPNALIATIPVLLSIRPLPSFKPPASHISLRLVLTQRPLQARRVCFCPYQFIVQLVRGPQPTRKKSSFHTSKKGVFQPLYQNVKLFDMSLSFYVYFSFLMFVGVF